MNSKFITPKIILLVLTFVILSVLSVPIHELGHALVYKLSGYDVSFHFTNAAPINGRETLPSAAAGIAVNLILAVVFLVFYYKSDNIFDFAVSASNINLRIVFYLVSVFRRGMPYDEAFISKVLGIDAKVTIIAIFVIMLLILFALLKRLYERLGKNQADKVSCALAVSTAMAFFIIAFLEEMRL